MKEEDTNMEIKRPAIAGTLESSDCQVMVEAGEGKIDLSLDSAVINQYGNQIRKVVLETLFFGLMPILISIAGEFGVSKQHTLRLLWLYAVTVQHLSVLSCLQPSLVSVLRVLRSKIILRNVSSGYGGVSIICLISGLILGVIKL